MNRQEQLDRLWHETGYEDMGIGFKHEPTDPRTDGIPYDLSKPIAPSDDMGGLVDVITSEQQAIADEADWQAMVDEKEKERRIANRKADR